MIKVRRVNCKDVSLMMQDHPDIIIQNFHCGQCRNPASCRKAFRMHQGDRRTGVWCRSSNRPSYLPSIRFIRFIPRYQSADKLC